jgi:hypothetical protein
MRWDEFSRLLESLAKLSKKQRAEVTQTLQIAPRETTLAARIANARLSEKRACPRC